MPLRPLAEAVFSGLPGEGAPSGGDLGPHQPLESARVLAEGAVATAGEVGLPEVACEALNMLGHGLRPRDLDEAEAAFARPVTTAEAHAMPVWRIRGPLGLGVLDRVRTDSPTAQP